jgi:hypothetical protein
MSPFSGFAGAGCTAGDDPEQTHEPRGKDAARTPPTPRAERNHNQDSGTTMKTAVLTILALAGALAPATQAMASRTVVYTTNFESLTPDPHWTNDHIEMGDWTHFTDFNGRLSNSYTEFSIPQPTLPSGTGGVGGTGNDGTAGGFQYAQYYVTFDLYTIDSWYGTPSNDQIIVTANNTDQLFSETFSTMPGFAQSYRAPDVGPVDMGFTAAQADAIYRSIDLPFTVPAGDMIRLRWNDGGGILGSWGIDNVTVSYEMVPAPGPLAAVGGMGLLSLRRRRR